MTNRECGFDGAKKVKGRKRHLLVDTLGLVILVIVTAAQVSDQAGAKQLLAHLKGQRRWFEGLLLIWADAAYRGVDFLRWVYDSCG